MKLYIIICFYFFISSLSIEAMNIADIRFVDQTPDGFGYRNYLFRGPYASSTADAKVWNHTALVEGLKIAAAAANVSLPSTFLVGDISLLTIEWQSLVSESQFYAANPSLGFFSHWPQFGTNLNASGFPAPVRGEIAASAPQPFGDFLPMMMDRLRLGLLLPSQRERDLSVVYYYHCQGGKDRTGQVSAAYYMRWLQMSWNDALYYDQNCVGKQRALKPALMFGAQWYCLELAAPQTTGDCLIQTPSLPSHPGIIPTPQFQKMAISKVFKDSLRQVSIEKLFNPEFSFL